MQPQVFSMQPIFRKSNQIVVFDLPNVVCRAIAVSEADFVLERAISMLLNYRKVFRQREFVFALEGNGSSRRAKILPEYKGNRGKLDSDTEAHLLGVVELLKRTNCKIIKAEDGEADDAIATYVEQHRLEGLTTIVTEDRDLWQLLTPNVTVMTRTGEVTIETCLRKFGVAPERIPMLKALLGDKSDNVPRSVPKVKKEILCALARATDTPEKIIEVLRSPQWTYPKVADRIAECVGRISTNLQVVTLQKNLYVQQLSYTAQIQELLRIMHDSTNRNYSRQEAESLAGIV